MIYSFDEFSQLTKHLEKTNADYLVLKVNETEYTINKNGDILAYYDVPTGLLYKAITKRHGKMTICRIVSI